MTTVIVAGSVLLFLAGLWLIVIWGGKTIQPPVLDGPYPNRLRPGPLHCAGTSGGQIFGASRL